jgi:glucuronate isomerase
MKKFMDESFLLETKSAEKLYKKYSDELPIIDYHSHLPPEDIANDRNFENITQVWLYGDHYKWRAMRANGVDEKYCTGSATDKEKFMKWAETVPATLRNPLYHWTHLELLRYFGISDLLSPDTAEKIWEQTEKLLQTKEYSVRNMLRRMNVEVVCTTDDPIDSLEHHMKILEDEFEIRVLPTWRPDKAMAVENSVSYNTYLNKLAEVSAISIDTYMDLLNALNKRHDFFSTMGCKLSDHGLESFVYAEHTHEDIERIFLEIRSGKELCKSEQEKFKTAILIELAVMDYEKGWTQQFHIGAIRNNNLRQFEAQGPDTGYDSIGDFSVARAMSDFFNRLDSQDELAKTIVYNLNPSDNALMVTMAYNFNDGITAGKMQFGSGWWFLDQKKGMEDQMNVLSTLGLIGNFVGMLTDSRSFLSFPRHEYFRRILCNLFGKDIENGEIPDDMAMVGKMVSEISYFNAKEYFGF